MNHLHTKPHDTNTVPEIALAERERNSKHLPINITRDMITGALVLLAVGILPGDFGTSFRMKSEWQNRGTNLPFVFTNAHQSPPFDIDILNAFVALRAARTQVKSMVAAEQQQRTLYMKRAAAQEDWQRSQSDLANAESTLHSAEIAIGAVRNRLRILGKTEAEIVAMGVEPTR